MTLSKHPLIGLEFNGRSVYSDLTNEDEMKDADKRKLVLILFFGSLWGLSEAVFGGLLYAAEIKWASIYLGAWALLLLALARSMLNIPGTSTAIGAVAAVFRLVNAGLFICHLGGIFILAAAFDIAAGLILKKSFSEKRDGLFRISGTVGTGILSAYLSNGLFALIFTFIIRYEYWAAGGWPKVLDHTFGTGSLLALAAGICVTLGWRIGESSRKFALMKPAFAPRFVLALSVGFWIIGRFAG